MQKYFVYALNKTRFLGYIAAKILGIHPKHLINKKNWYVPYISKSDIVLDIGCDYHFIHSKNISPLCKEVYAFDINVKPQDIGNIHVIKHDATKPFPYENNKFDKVLFFDVIEHLPETDFCMKEISRVLKPKGKLLITLPNSQTPWKCIKKKYGLNYFSDSDHKREYTLKEVKQLLNKYGFKIESIKPVTKDTPFIGFIDITSLISLKLYKKLTEYNQAKANMINTTGFRVIAINNN